MARSDKINLIGKVNDRGARGEYAGKKIFTLSRVTENFTSISASGSRAFGYIVFNQKIYPSLFTKYDGKMYIFFLS